jgi:hypothetical protein
MAILVIGAICLILGVTALVLPLLGGLIAVIAFIALDIFLFKKIFFRKK